MVEPMGCDGSRIECCRSTELDARLGHAGNDDSAPTVWLTALVHLASGTLWSWRLGPGAAAEVVHLRHLLGTLSPQALIICDAAYMGYDLVRAILKTRRLACSQVVVKFQCFEELSLRDRQPLS
jgi:hypothetical protein